MRIFSRHLLFRFFTLLFIILFATITIFVVIDFVENSTDWINRPNQEAFEYYLNYIPHIIYLVMPLAILLASVFSVGHSARHLELTALRGAGVSPYRILSPLVFWGVLVSGGMYWFGEQVLPDANHRRFAIKEPLTQKSDEIPSLEKSKFVYVGPQNTTYFINSYSGTQKKGQGVTLLQDTHGELVQRYDAASIHWDGHWVLQDGTHRQFEKNRTLQVVPFKSKILKNVTDTPEDLVNTRIYPDEMRIKELDKRIDILKRTGESSRKFETQRHFKVSGAWVNFIMLVLGASLAFHTGRTGITRQIGISLGIAFAYFFLIRLGLTLGENGGLPPREGAWLGNVVFGVLGVLLFIRAGLR